MESPFTGMRKSAPSKEGTTYRSHSYSMTDISEVKAPAIALRGMRGMPFWLPCGSLWMPAEERIICMRAWVPFRLSITPHWRILVVIS